MAKSTAKRTTTIEATTDSDTLNEDRRKVLEHQLHSSKTAFSKWEGARDRSDKALYEAIGHLAEFVAAVGNDHDALISFARDQGIKVTKATSSAVAVAKMVISADKSKASKYATVLQYAALKGVQPISTAVAEFIAREGGIEACLRAYREMPREGSGKAGAGRPSAYGQAVTRIASIVRIKAPKDLAVSTSEDGYFVMVGVRNPDGTLQFFQKAVDDEKLIRAAVTSIGKTSEVEDTAGEPSTAD